MENPESKPENGPVTKVTRTGVFKGEWTEICQFCGKEQNAHRTTMGPFNGELLEHRLPCPPEKEAITKEFKARASLAKHIVAFRWVLVPLAILLIKKFTIVGWIVFGVSLLGLLWDLWKIYGKRETSEKEKKKQEEELEERHMLYHCKRNPEAFRRLVIENFKREDEEKENGNKGDNGSDTKGTPPA